MHKSAALAACAAVIFGASTQALTIYDGALNTAPESQGLLAFSSLTPSTYRTVSPGKVTFNSGANSNQVGWANNLFPLGNFPLAGYPTFDSTQGFVLGFDMKVLSESHDNNDRSGFSILLLDSNHTGVQLEFWTNEVWAQTLSGTNFVHGEGSAFTTTNQTHYDLEIHNGTYQLFANNSQILTGSTRDYLPGDATPDPYGLANYLFVGDTTTSATASAEISSLTLVPEPTCAMLLGAGMMFLGCRRKR
jgi:hypothetical protein